MNLRRAVLFALLALTLAAVWWVEREAAEPVLEVVGAARPPLRPTPPAQRLGEAAVRFPGGGADLFAPRSWRPPPPAPIQVEAPPPPPPTAPPLPFRYVGRWVDDSGETVFLALGERVLAARAGQRLDAWRLDKVSAQGLEFTYEPLNQQRQLRWTP